MKTPRPKNKIWASSLLLACAATPLCAAAPKPQVTVFELVPRAAPQALHPGCAVKLVVPGSPADKAGIKAGDVILSLDRKAGMGEGFEAFFSSAGPAAAFLVEVARGSQTIHLEARPSEDLDPPGVTCDLGDVKAAQGEAVLAIKGLVEVLAQADVIGPAAFVWVRVRNNSTRPLKVSPDMFSASTADWTILNPIRFSDMVAAMQAMETSGRFAGRVANYTPSTREAFLSQIPKAADLIPVPGAGMILKQSNIPQMINSMVPTHIPFMGGSSPKGPALKGVSKGFISTWIPSSGDMDRDMAVAANEIVRRKAFAETVLAPGYAQEGYLYYEQPDVFPLRVSADLGEGRFSLLFDEEIFTMTAEELEAYAAGIPESARKQAMLANGLPYEGDIRGFDSSAHGFVTRIRKEGKDVKGKLLVKDIRMLKAEGRNAIVVEARPQAAPKPNGAAAEEKDK